MPAAISRDLRTRVVEAYKNGEGTYVELAKRFGVGEASVDRWVALDRATGDVTPLPQGGRRTFKIGLAERLLLADWVREDPDVILADLQRRLEDECGVKVHLSNVHRTLRALGFTKKKKSFVHAKRETDRVKDMRAEHAQAAAIWSPEDLVFLDECGINLAMRQTHGWSPRGERVVGVRPVHRGANLTVVGAMSLSGPIAVTPWPAALDGDGFLAWLEAFLIPKLRRGQILIMDNLRVHKVAGVREMLEEAGLKIVFLPPYSPDLNPIEECWSKIKHWVRRIAARGMDELKLALKQATEKVTSADARGWFAHAGYPVST